MNEIIETPITDDPYSLFAGICSLCGKWIHWAELHLVDEFGLEKRHIDFILQRTEFNISKAARILKIDRKTLYDKIKKYNLN